MFNKNQFILDWVDHFQQPTGYDHEIVIPLEIGEINLIARYFAYKKKEDFIFSLINDDKTTAEELSSVYEEMRWEERAEGDIELVEVSWRYESEVHQLQLSMKDRVYIIQKFMPFLKEFLTSGYGGPTPKENIMAVAKPQGFKYNNLGYVDGEAGQRQRAMIAKRCGIGLMKDCGWSFAKYGADRKLHPL
jgi:hypothetical protein